MIMPFKFYEADIEAATAAVRRLINESGYGAFVSDTQCREFAIAVLVAVREHRKK